MFSFDSAADGVTIHVYEWQPADSPRGVVQISHGMGEHAARYEHVATTLTAAGLAVYADDHRGHGRSIEGTAGDLGTGGWSALVADMAQLTAIIRDRHPGLPVILLGHSLGSFAAQQYILDDADRIDGLVMTGTTAVDVLLPNLPAPEPGGSVLAALNGPFQPARTDFDWLSRDEAQVDAYVADPLCGFDLTPEALGDVFGSAGRWVDSSGVRADLPIAIFVGAADPLTGGGALSELLAQRYRDSGHSDVAYKAYPDARHEILNETNRDQVENDIVAWINQTI